MIINLWRKKKRIKQSRRCVRESAPVGKETKTERPLASFLEVLVADVQATAQGVVERHVLGGRRPHPRAVPARADVHQLGVAVGLAEGGEARHAVQHRQLAAGGAVAVDALQQPEDEVAHREEALRVVVLVVAMHHHQRGGLRERGRKGEECRSIYIGTDELEEKATTTTILNVVATLPLCCK